MDSAIIIVLFYSITLEWATKGSMDRSSEKARLTHASNLTITNYLNKEKSVPT